MKHDFANVVEVYIEMKTLEGTSKRQMVRELCEGTNKQFSAKYVNRWFTEQVVPADIIQAMQSQTINFILEKLEIKVSRDKQKKLIQMTSPPVKEN